MVKPTVLWAFFPFGHCTLLGIQKCGGLHKLMSLCQETQIKLKGRVCLSLQMTPITQNMKISVSKTKIFKNVNLRTFTFHDYYCSPH